MNDVIPEPHDYVTAFSLIQKNLVLLFLNALHFSDGDLWKGFRLL